MLHKSHLLSCSGTCCSLFLDLNHKGLFSTLRTRARLNLLKPLELELFTDLGLGDLASHGIVSVDLRIGQAHGDKALLLLFLCLHPSVALLQNPLCFVLELILHDVIDRSLGPKRAPISMLLVRQGCRSISLLVINS